MQPAQQAGPADAAGTARPAAAPLGIADGPSRPKRPSRSPGKADRRTDPTRQWPRDHEYHPHESPKT